MTRLCIVVEGQSEERFVSSVLAPHLDAMQVWTTLMIVTTSRAPTGEKRRGGGQWRHWLRDIRTLCRDRCADFRITTMFDLYGLPNDFPGMGELKDVDTRRRADALERTMAEAVDDRRFLPNLMRHEFEALVLAATGQLMSLLDEESQRDGLRSLTAELATIAPEDVDDGEHTAPSKRLENRIAGYRKITHGVPALEAAGLPALRGACPRFGKWISQLEQLAVGES